MTMPIYLYFIHCRMLETYHSFFLRCYFFGGREVKIWLIPINRSLTIFIKFHLNVIILLTSVPFGFLYIYNIYLKGKSLNDVPYCMEMIGLCRAIFHFGSVSDKRYSRAILECYLPTEVYIWNKWTYCFLTTASSKLSCF